LTDGGEEDPKIKYIVAIVGALAVIAAAIIASPHFFPPAHTVEPNTSIPAQMEKISKMVTGGKLLYPSIEEMNASRIYMFGAYIALNDSIDAAMREMTTGTAVVMKKPLNVSNNLTINGVKTDFRTGSNISEAPLAISPLMRVNLIGDGTFTISRQNDEVQAISGSYPGSHYAEWLWTVRPNEVGIHYLTLIPYTIIRYPDNPDIPLQISPAANIRIKVNVNPELPSVLNDSNNIIMHHEIIAYNSVLHMLLIAAITALVFAAYRFKRQK
jgi:hypothetical protein